jgi:nanoRNase/pAp phosphatase (c-di-AMP/oligoRNAs hydrolase)
LTTSLRSKNQDLEVHKFAETVQGGGHKQAAGAKFGEEYSYNAEKIIQHYIDFIGGVIK